MVRVIPSRAFAHSAGLVVMAAAVLGLTALSGSASAEARLDVWTVTHTHDDTATAPMAMTTRGVDVAERPVPSSSGGLGFTYDPSGHSDATNTAGVVDDAANAAQGARLREHLRLLEQYGAGGVRELADGRIRYYSEVTIASKPGEMAGARLVREWNPATGNYRTWYETLDHAGQIRQVHPYQPYSSYHYMFMFDEFGNYAGRG